jgi:outer membrane receptor protein involved in Fe transport
MYPSTTNCQVDFVTGQITFDADGRCFRYQSQYLNIGAIRNQGWELQGSVNTGPLTTRGTYSWSKSRIIGIIPKYRTLLDRVSSGYP